MKNNLILTGYMGSGKTSVGRALARMLESIFLDTDHLIEEQEGCSISEIFSGKGEEAFREMETACLKELIRKRSVGVISVGGGTPLREENRQLMKRLGRVVYLQADPDTIFERIRNDHSRPLLQTEDPRKRIEEMVKQREPAYLEAADQVIRVDGRRIEEIAEEILKHENFGD